MYRRVRIYLVGVFLGCILVYFTLIQGREDDLLGWMPKQRVLAELNNPNMLKSDSISCIIDCYQISDTEFKRVFEDGNVRLSQSQTHSNPKIYAVEWENNLNETFLFQFELTDSYSRLISVSKQGKKTDCICN